MVKKTLDVRISPNNSILTRECKNTKLVDIFSSNFSMCNYKTIIALKLAWYRLILANSLISTVYRLITPNIQLKWLKIFYRAKQKQEFRDKVQELQGLKWITVHQIWFIDRRSRDQTCHSCENLPLYPLFCLFSWYFFASITFGDGFLSISR